MDVIEELLDETAAVDRRYVERRIEDWRRQIADLYADVKAWLPPGWTAREDGSVPMREELMQRFDVPEQRLPLLRLEAEDGRQGRIEPRGLWIIAINGRIDLILPDRHYVIINREDSFEPPNWRISSLMDRLHYKPFDRQSLRDALT